MGIISHDWHREDLLPLKKAPGMEMEAMELTTVPFSSSSLVIKRRPVSSRIIFHDWKTKTIIYELNIKDRLLENFLSLLQLGLTCLPAVFQKPATCVVSLNRDITSKFPTSFRHCRFLSSVTLMLMETDFPWKGSDLHASLWISVCSVQASIILQETSKAPFPSLWPNFTRIGF